MHRFQPQALARIAGTCGLNIANCLARRTLKRVLQDLCPSLPGYRLVFELRRIRERHLLQPTVLSQRKYLGNNVVFHAGVRA